jgi:hypothetical protein
VINLGAVFMSRGFDAPLLAARATGVQVGLPLTF